MKKRYRVRLNLPVMLDVVLDWDDWTDDELQPHHHYRAAILAALAQVENDDNRGWYLADTFNDFGSDLKGYPLDYGDVDDDGHVIPDNVEVHDFTLADICPSCDAGMTGSHCHYCGYDNPSWPLPAARR